ncbi:MAG TPA: porin [Candidatus Acidoferrales bacterium]|nr:porin [Candidatus Acidoferrales bacterium]
MRISSVRNYRLRHHRQQIRSVIAHLIVALRVVRLTGAVGLGCIVALGAAHSVRAQDPPAVDQLLEILRRNRQISPQQYQDLKNKAEQERQEDLKKAAAPPPVVAAPRPALVATAPSPSPDTLRAYFKNGFNLETADGNYKLVLGSFTQLDSAVADPGASVKRHFSLTGTSTGAEFRRARLYVAGLVYGNIDFKFEYDFAEQTGGQPSFKDVYIGMNQIPVLQYVRVGHFKEPFSLEELVLDAFTTFQERSLANAFALPVTNFVTTPAGVATTTSGTDRNTGIAAYQNFLQQRMTTAAGAFRLADNFGDGFGSDSPYDIAARITGLPLYDTGGQNLLHLGFSYSHKFRHYAKDSPETIGFASRPEAHLFPVNLVSTGNVNTNGADLLNPEVSLVTGPFSVQGEYTWALVDQSNLNCTGTPLTCKTTQHSNPQFGGGYIEASYFLTGESRASFYKTQVGYYDRIIPNHNFAIDGSHWGAWQVAARYSYLDLNSASVKGGALDDITGGINWYLNPVTRITLNYIWAHRESVGDSNVVEARFQLVF